MSSVAAPQLPAQLDALDDLQQALRHNESVSGVAVQGSDLAGIKIKSLTITDAKLSKISAVEADLEKLELLDVHVQHSELTAANCADASWCRVQLKNMRCSGLKLQTSTLKDVAFEDCKLDLVNFRFAKLKNVTFKNCSLNESDFYMARLENVQFQYCTFNKCQFSGATLKNVDLRTSDLTDLSGVSGLAGATIDHVQLIALAPLLASENRIAVREQ